MGPKKTENPRGTPSTYSPLNALHEMHCDRAGRGMFPRMGREGLEGKMLSQVASSPADPNRSQTPTPSPLPEEATNPQQRGATRKRAATIKNVVPLQKIRAEQPAQHNKKTPQKRVHTTNMPNHPEPKAQSQKSAQSPMPPSPGTGTQPQPGRGSHRTRPPPTPEAVN
ncbi:hypothetical protein CRENBAI_006189 [Crenichthys baileyi]|uniref:Uncharacterized protein n=1 Tax=Crenichthys baileyi TaxID=28760 RepID=A0AAV9S1Y2_9TELE